MSIKFLFKSGRAALPAATRLLVCLMVLLLISIDAGAQQSPATIATGDAQPSDVAIEQRLKGIFDELEGFAEISVEVQAGVVTLTGQVLRPELAGQAEQLAAAVEGVVTVQNDLHRDSRFSRQIQPVFSKLSAAVDAIIVGLPLFLLALAVMLAFWWLGRLVAGRLKFPSGWAPNLFVEELLRLVIRLLLGLVGVVLAAELMGATALLVSVLGGLGVVGLAVGFAIRDTVENFVASVLLSLRQPFGANEHVIVDGNEGRVVRLTSRATILLDMDGNHVRLPNSTVYKSTIINFSRNPKRRFKFDVGVDTDIAPRFAQQLAVEALSKLDGVLEDPAPLCVVQKLGDSNVVLGVYGWVDQRTSDFSKTRSAAMATIKQTFEQADINMPEPIYRLRVENVPAKMQTENAAAATAAIEHNQAEDLRPDTAIHEQVRNQRVDGDDDLLNKAAPRE